MRGVFQDGLEIRERHALFVRSKLSTFQQTYGNVPRVLGKYIYYNAATASDYGQYGNWYEIDNNLKIQKIKIKRYRNFVIIFQTVSNFENFEVLKIFPKEIEKESEI